MTMFKQKIFIYSFIVLIIVAIFQNLGTSFDLYTIYPWYDIPMHILGGLWVSLFTLSIYIYFFNNTSIPNYRKKVFQVMCITLLFVAVSWEIFEIIGHMTFLSDGIWYWIDTIKDIFDDFIGGMLGYYFYTRNNQ